MDVTSLCHVKNTDVIFTVKSPFNWIFVGIVVFSEEVFSQKFEKIDGNHCFYFLLWKVK